MKIDLTAREWFAISRGGIGRTSKRKLFKTINLSNKIFEQFSEQITVEELDSLEKEWLAIKTDIPPIPPKSQKISEKVVAKTAPKRVETRVWRPD
jgi:hypothetical protein